jgi:hypothetical protein
MGLGHAAVYHTLFLMEDFGLCFSPGPWGDDPGPGLNGRVAGRTRSRRTISGSRHFGHNSSPPFLSPS